ncbi:hypothetical protein BJX62DRAFT_240880 [Aspergillus germanicus]
MQNMQEAQLVPAEPAPGSEFRRNIQSDRGLELKPNIFAGPIVTLIPDDAATSYNVHERLLRDASRFSDRALAGPWTEAQTRTVRLPDDDSETVGIYVYWLYYDTLPAGYRDSKAEYLDLARAYVFGDKVLDVRFQDKVSDAIVNKSRFATSGGARTLPTATVVAYIYEYSVKNAPIRRAFVDMWTQYGHHSLLQSEIDTIPRAFAVELAANTLKQQPYLSYARNLDPSEYHQSALQGLPNVPQPENPPSARGRMVDGKWQMAFVG